MQQTKKKIWKTLAYIGILSFVVFLWRAQAADVVSYVFSSQNATAPGSNNSIISVDANLAYVNRGNNSSIIGNFFTGYYYDDVLGYFEVDWSSNREENVRIKSSTPACWDSYGYKLGWYAYSTAFGFVDFDYNSSVFVYYCLDDSSLHGYAYSEDLWFQNFEGITFDIATESDIVEETPTASGAFLNDGTDITDEPINVGDIIPDRENPIPGKSENSNFTPKTIQADIIELNADQESLFYIIK